MRSKQNNFYTHIELGTKNRRFPRFFRMDLLIKFAHKDQESREKRAYRPSDSPGSKRDPPDFAPVHN